MINGLKLEYTPSPKKNEADKPEPDQTNPFNKKVDMVRTPTMNLIKNAIRNKLHPLLSQKYPRTINIH